VTTPELLILSRRNVEAYEPEGIEICISISDPDLNEAHLSENFAAVLRLAFFDLLAPITGQSIVFNAEHADAVVRFVAAWPQADRIVVHCGAGLSRSPGVALGLCDRAGWPTDDLERRYPLWNTLVRSVLAARPRLVASDPPR
jgi:predicted protein tyrosine phosphatase